MYVGCVKALLLLTVHGFLEIAISRPDGHYHSFFFLEPGFTPFHGKRTEIQTSSSCQEEGKRVERVQALPGNPPHSLAVETDAMGRKPGSTNFVMSITSHNQPGKAETTQNK